MLAAKFLQLDLLNLAMWCAKWRIKLNPEKAKVNIFSRHTRQKNRTQPKTVWRDSSEISRNYFRLPTQFQKALEDILDRCSSRYHRFRVLANKKWGPSPSTLIQIYKQCVRPIFEYGSLSTITISDYIISKIQRLKFKI